MSLASYQNIEEHFDTIDCSIFSGELLEDAEAVAEMKAYLKRWSKAIEEHETVDENLEQEEKASCDFSVLHIPTGNVRYEKFNGTHHPLFNPNNQRMSPRSFQETAENLIFTWNAQSADHEYKLERSWWNGNKFDNQS